MHSLQVHIFMPIILSKKIEIRFFPTIKIVHGCKLTPYIDFSKIIAICLRHNSPVIDVICYPILSFWIEIVLSSRVTFNRFYMFTLRISNRKYMRKTINTQNTMLYRTLLNFLLIVYFIKFITCRSWEIFRENGKWRFFFRNEINWISCAMKSRRSFC